MSYATIRKQAFKRQNRAYYSNNIILLVDIKERQKQAYRQRTNMIKQRIAGIILLVILFMLMFETGGGAATLLFGIPAVWMIFSKKYIMNFR